MEKRLLIVSVLATALALQTGLTFADSTSPAPLQENSQIHNRQQISKNQPVTQQPPPAKTGEEQEQAPVILQIRIVKVAD
jgi:hypothetical protein